MKAVGDIEVVNLASGETWQRIAGDGESVLQSRGPIDEVRLGPQRDVVFGPRECEPTPEEIVRQAQRILEMAGIAMHYRNGREAKNGDKIIKLERDQIISFGVLHSATPGNDYCNGNIAVIQPPNDYACIVDCLHVEDVAALLREKGLDKRPSGK
jgi:hypothetical protein